MVSEAKHPAAERRDPFGRGAQAPLSQGDMRRIHNELACSII
jgi:hypothetical protein